MSLSGLMNAVSGLWASATEQQRCMMGKYRLEDKQTAHRVLLNKPNRDRTEEPEGGSVCVGQPDPVCVCMCVCASAVNRLRA